MRRKKNILLAESLFKSIVDNIHEGVYFVDLERRITYWNKGAERITGYTAEEVVGKSCSANLLVHIDGSGGCLCTTACPLVDTMRQCNVHSSSQLFLHHKAGHRVAINTSISVIKDDDGNPVGAVEIFSEATAFDQDRQLIDDLKREALIDLLTGLPNRRYLQMTLTGCIAEFERYGAEFGVIFTDIDHFKQVNDNFGHEVGDHVLRLVANSMSTCLRTYDTLGRWGGEEFLVIVRLVDKAQLIKVAEKLRKIVESCFLFHEGQKIEITITLGATLMRADDNLDSVVKRADQLMYEGKRGGRNCVKAG